MTNIFLPADSEIVYISVDDVKDSTSKAAIASLSDDEIKQLIYEAQIEIDKYLGICVEPYDEDQTWVFPTLDSDEASFMPTEIPIATLYTLEYIYVLGDTITSGATSGGAVIKEVVGDHTVQYSEGVVASTDGLKIPNEAIGLLKKYKQTFNLVTL